MGQIKNSFDSETIGKIIRGALIAATGAAAIALLNYFGELKIDNVALAGFIAWIVPVAVNAVKEYLKGETGQ